MEICVSPQHRFGTDAFLLADFASPRRIDRVCDLGTGCGIIPMLMSRREPPRQIYGVEIQPQAVEQLRLSLERSGLTRIEPICADLNALWPEAPLAALDLVTCNPPYKAPGSGFESGDPAHRIARHEVLCTLEDVCRAGERLLKFGGRLCLCNRPERLADTVFAMKACGIEPKRLRFVSKTPKDAPWLFLMEGKKGGKPFMRVLPQLYVYTDQGEFTGEMLQIYGKLPEEAALKGELKGYGG